MRNASNYNLLATVALAALVTFATSPALAGSKVNADKSGVAIKGYDPVAYFTSSKPTAGNAELTHRWNNATWRFANAENKKAFVANPTKYAPQYGGYCAFAVSQGNLAPIDPKAWRIVDGKLYLNYNTAVQKKWEKDRKNFIRLADEKWPELGGK